MRLAFFKEKETRRGTSRCFQIVRVGELVSQSLALGARPRNSSQVFYLYFYTFLSFKKTRLSEPLGNQRAVV